MSPARWLVLTVRAASPDEAFQLAQGLVSLGGRAVRDEGERLVTYLPEPADPEAFVADARAKLRSWAGRLDLEVETGWRAHEDWAELWKRDLAPRRVTDRLVVTPSWCEPETSPDDLVLTLDPGVAFGTAEHGTTRGCLRLLDRILDEGDRVVDVGAGSGILSIGAALMGAGAVLALESDPYAVEAARENVRANGVEERVEVRKVRVEPGTLVALTPRDGIVANIGTGVLRALLPGFGAALPAGGWLILSGSPRPEWSELARDVEQAGFRLVHEEDDEGWPTGGFSRTSPTETAG